MTDLKTTPKAIIAIETKPALLRYFIDHGVDIKSDGEMAKHLGYARDCHQGRKKGIEELGYKVFFIDRPSYLVPALVRRIFPGFYVTLLGLVKRVPGIKQLDELFHNIHLYYLVKKHRPRFLLFCSKRIAPWTVLQCKKFGCDTIEYKGAAPSVGPWDQTIRRNAKYIFSNCDFTKLMKVDLGSKFFVAHIGADKDIYGEPDFDRSHRPLDISAVGSYNDKRIFILRTQITNELLESTLSSQLKIAIHGYDALDKDTKYSSLKQSLSGPVYGIDYINVLKASKMSLVVPSDDHIAVGGGMPQRIFQNAAAGCMQLVYNCDAVKDIFTANEEIVLFADVPELIEKVKYYLEHDEERIRIARNAYERFLHEYTSQKQIQLFLKKIYKNKFTCC